MSKTATIRARIEPSLKTEVDDILDQLGLEGGKHRSRNLWTDKAEKEAKEISVTLPAHGSAVFQVQ